MADSKIRVVFLWHMHQPYYKDMLTGTYRLPWTRLHGLKDYYGMVAMLEEFPRIHQTFNLVPSLLSQLQEYASGEARETILDAAIKPANELTHAERLFILRCFFHANTENLISRYPRYRELYDRVKANDFVAERAITFFRESDFTDLQVLSQLAWFDEIYLAQDREIQALVSKRQGYSYTDQVLLHKKQREVISKSIEAYREAAARGQIEISTSPFYHPILPLLCDTDVASQAHPGVRLPLRRFRHPEDARLQLERAIAFHRQMFGMVPNGLWPSEGSVSAEVLEICSSLGFRWVATDQQVLSNSIGVPFYHEADGAMVNADRLYAPYSFSTVSGPVRLLFRDHELSDLIGFVYSKMEPAAAAEDFVRRIRRSGQSLISREKNAIVSIILDGENAWEYYPQNGRPFLRTLYSLISKDPQLECVTVSEALELHGTALPLPKLAAGSWINANFDIWIGAEEDNRAWDYLSEARDFFSARQRDVPPEKKDLALDELLVAEGSDWNWWYGPEHSTANDADFDELYRSHLANVYRAIGDRPPDYLGQPISAVRQQVAASLPEAPISALIDGAVTTYFEWMGAGFYSPLQAGAAMHGRSPLMRELHYGRNDEDFFLRIDFHASALEAIGNKKLRIVFRPVDANILTMDFAAINSNGNHSCTIRREGDGSDLAESMAQAALGKILEARFSFDAIGQKPSASFDFQVSIWEDGHPREIFPLEGWIEVPVPE